MSDVIEAPEAVEPIEPTESAPEDITSSEEPAAEPVAAAEPDDVKGDDRTLPQWVKNLKGVDPKAYREARNNFFGQRTLQEKLKGFDLDKTRTWLEENGGLDGIEMSRQEAQAKAQELDALNEAFSTGDTKVIDRIADSEGFSKLVPAALSALNQRNPEAWNATLAPIFDATIRSSPLPENLKAMQYHMNDLNVLLGSIPDVANNPLLVQKWTEMTQQFGEVNKWTQSFKGQPQQPGQQQAAPKSQQTEQQVRATLENERFQQTQQTQLNTWRASEVKKELGSYFERQKDNVDLQEIATERVMTKVLERMNADKDYQGKMSALFARKDAAGMERLYKSREGAAIKEIAPAVGRSIFGNPKTVETPKPATPARTAPRPSATPADPKRAALAEIFAR